MTDFSRLPPLPQWGDIFNRVIPGRSQTLVPPQQLFGPQQNPASRPPSPTLSGLNGLSGPDRLQSPPATSAQTEVNFIQSPLIGPDARVLHIGDSHTVGIYGQHMDKLLRETGARVETYGSAGSRPSWFVTGRNTRSGFYGKNEEGVVDKPAKWNDPHPTPKFEELLRRFNPNVIMVSLGANLFGASAEQVKADVDRLFVGANGQPLDLRGKKLIWIGPPDGRADKKPAEQQAALYRHLQAAIEPYGASFIDSRPMTEYPDTPGLDGRHYWGKEGVREAREWAAEVLDQVQALPE